MNENNKIDDLFQANSDYLSEQPHPDFDPEAFWQQLRPELAQPKRKIAGWWWASAAVVALALLIGGIWWMQLGKVGLGKAVAEKPAVSLPSPKTETLPVPEPSNSTENGIQESRLAVKKATKKHAIQPEVQQEVPDFRKDNQERDSSIPETATKAEVVATTESPEQQPEVLAAETSVQIVKKPHYRVVHLNEILPQKEQKSQNRTRVALRIGIAGVSAPQATEPKIPLAIPINN